MTIEETKQLRIEFERRLQIMYPNSKFLEKLNSDTIYSILNEYQIKYVKQLYLSQIQQDLKEIGSRNVDNILHPLLCVTEASVDEDEFVLPEDYLFYVRSTCDATVSYKGVPEEALLTNILIENKEANEVLTRYHNYAGIIRNPQLIVNDNLVTIIHDLYTEINNVTLLYYRFPKNFGQFGKSKIDKTDKEFSDIVYNVSPVDIVEWQFGSPIPIVFGEISHDSIEDNVDVVYDATNRRFLLALRDRSIYCTIPDGQYQDYSSPENGHTYYCKKDKCRYVWQNGDLIRYIQPCELPSCAFDDLVSGALQLYVFGYKFALATAASNTKYDKLKNGVDKLAQDNKQGQQ